MSMPNPLLHTKAHHRQSDRSTWTLPVLVSVLGHAIILVIISAPIISPPKTDSSIQTTLVSQAQFTEASQALKAHHNAQNSPPSHASLVNEANTQSLRSHRTHTQHSSSHLGSDEQSLTFDDTNFFDINNAHTISESANNIDAVTAQAENAAARDSDKQNSQPSRDEINTALASVKNRIERIWKHHPNQPNQTISFQVNLDDQGNVISISFGGGHPDLRESVSASVYAAAPFKELAGIRNSVKMQFHTEQLLSQSSGTDQSAD